MKKVILVSIDGMRPDGLTACGNPYVEQLLKESRYTLKGTTVWPSVTLPAHMSMFHSAPPQVHGIIYNDYLPPIHKVKGLFEHLASHGKAACWVYNWEHLRDIVRPGNVQWSMMLANCVADSTDTILTDAAIQYIDKMRPHFAFVYMGETDHEGHEYGWMSKEYLNRISIALDNVKKLVENFGDEYLIVVTADHGGHDRLHGLDTPEDMTIPIILHTTEKKTGQLPEGSSILDIAPTISAYMELPQPACWEGKSLL